MCILFAEDCPFSEHVAMTVFIIIQFYYLAGLIQPLLRNVQYGDVSSTDLDMFSNSGCACIGYTCGCCAHIEVDKIGLNDTGIQMFKKYSGPV